LPLRDAIANRNDKSAGKLRNGVLSESFVVQKANWHPLADDGPAIPVEVYGDEGRAPSVPGPLLRARLGTRIDLRLRNTLPDTFFYSIGCGYSLAPEMVSSGALPRRTCETLGTEAVHLRDR
jgi:FtsP/CotA-like multicopper oxidase with cupredoxin domain